MPVKRRQLLISFLVAGALLAAGIGVGVRLAPLPPLPQHVHSPDEDLPIPDFALTDANGQTFDTERLRGRWSVLFFGFTNCPDVCPSTLLTLKQFSAQIKAKNAVAPQIVFVSLDPHRDTPEKLRDFVQFFDPEFVAVTGNQAELRKLALPIGGPYDYEDVDTGDLIRDVTVLPPDKPYQVHHSGSLFFVAPDGNLAAYALPPHDTDKLLATFDIVRKRYERWF